MNSTITVAKIGLIGVISAALITGAVTIYNNQHPSLPPSLPSSDIINNDMEEMYVGRLVDDKTQLPVKNATITLVGTGIPLTTFTDSNGIFAVPRKGLANGLRVNITVEGFTPSNFIVSPSRRVEDIRLSKIIASPSKGSPVPKSKKKMTIPSNIEQSEIIRLQNIVSATINNYSHYDSFWLSWRTRRPSDGVGKDGRDSMIEVWSQYYLNWTVDKFEDNYIILTEHERDKGGDTGTNKSNDTDESTVTTYRVPLNDKYMSFIVDKNFASKNPDEHLAARKKYAINVWNEKLQNTIGAIFHKENGGKDERYFIFACQIFMSDKEEADVACKALKNISEIYKRRMFIK